MKVCEGPGELKDALASHRRAGRSIGFVPTMGALHAGHLSLVDRARRENDVVAVSIFVNPTQFDDEGDLEAYPRSLESDRRLLDGAGAHLLFLPPADHLYADGYRFKVSEGSLSRELEGAHRPGHFDGVLTVVLKLLGLVGADRAYFGEKDWQQYLLIRDMARAFFLDTRIVPCPSVREEDGLAMSSRNARLTPEDRQRAPALHRILRGEGSADKKRTRLEQAGFSVDYVERRGDRLLAAVTLGEVRLIDNVEL